MKYKSTKTHVIVKFSRRELRSINRILDLGICDVESPSSYDKDVEIAELLCMLRTEPDPDPKFRKVEA